MTDLISLYVAHLATVGRADTTVETYAYVLRKADRDLPYGLTAATADELRVWVFAPELSPASRRLRRAAAVGFFAWATDEDAPRLDYNPARRLPSARVPQRASRAPADVQIATVLREVKPRFRLLFVLGAFVGLRCIELSALDREHITEESVWVQGKGGKERLVPCHPVVWAAVRDLPPGPVLVDQAGRRLDRQQVSRRGNRMLTRLGHRNLRMHDLRRWFGTSTYEASDRDIRVVQELLGHASVADTQRYVAAKAGRMASAVAGLPTWGAVQ